MISKRKTKSLLNGGPNLGTLAIVIREEIIRSLRACLHCENVKKSAACRLGVDQSTLSRHIISLKIERSEWAIPIFLQPITLKAA